MSRPRAFDEEQTLDACVEEFRARSYAGTSTQDLCDRTGLSRSSLYNAFRSKQGVYGQALRRYDARLSESRGGYLDAEGTGRELLEGVLREALRDQQSCADRRICLVVHAAVEVGRSEPEIAEVARGNLDAFAGLLAQLVARGQRDGSLTSTLPAEQLGRVVQATLNGAQVRGRVADDEEAEEIVSGVLALL